MEYPKRSVNGHAGEYLAAYRLTRELGWPCRLYGVDLGVDAEIEIMDEDETSTGDIVKVQIKAVSAIGERAQAHIYADDAHIEYWKRFCLPVIICCVDLSTEKVYWKQITATEAFQSQGASRKISFCLVEDELNANSRTKFRSLVHPPESRQIKQLFDELNGAFGRLPSADAPYSSFDDLAAAEERVQDVQRVLQRLEPVLAHFPWRISAYARSEYIHIKESLRVLKNHLSYSGNVIANGG